jgi:Putative serine esterase (DUF676)
MEISLRILSKLFLTLVLVFTLIIPISCQTLTPPTPTPDPEITPSLKQSSPDVPLLGSSRPIDYTQAYLLFCHGMAADSATFNTFADYAVNTLHVPADHIFRTNVDATAYCGTRAQHLASYIIQISQENPSIADHSLIAVGHSQGGLDLRYMIGNPDKETNMGLAANKIRAVYTIATPHGGTFAANSGADQVASLYDISERHNFNDREELSYDRMKSADGAQIPFVALTFRAAQPPGNDQASCRMSSSDADCTAEEFVDNGRLDRWTDGEVYWNRQIFTSKSGESPPFWGPYEGCHCAGKRYSWELGQTDKLKMIIAHALSGAQVTLTVNLADIPEPAGGFGSKQGVWQEGGYWYGYWSDTGWHSDINPLVFVSESGAGWRGCRIVCYSSDQVGWTIDVTDTVSGQGTAVYEVRNDEHWRVYLAYPQTANFKVTGAFNRMGSASCYVVVQAIEAVPTNEPDITP